MIKKRTRSETPEAMDTLVRYLPCTCCCWNEDEGYSYQISAVSQLLLACMGLVYVVGLLGRSFWNSESGSVVSSR